MLDVGAGVGVAGLCLLARVSGVHVTAVEIDPQLAALSDPERGAKRIRRQFLAVAVDVTSPGKALGEAGLKREGYHHLIANPPFHAERKVQSGARFRAREPRMSCVKEAFPPG